MFLKLSTIKRQCSGGGWCIRIHNCNIHGGGGGGFAYLFYILLLFSLCIYIFFANYNFLYHLVRLKRNSMKITERIILYRQRDQWQIKPSWMFNLYLILFSLLIIYTNVFFLLMAHIGFNINNSSGLHTLTWIEKSWTILK